MVKQHYSFSSTCMSNITFYKKINHIKVHWGSKEGSY